MSFGSIDTTAERAVVGASRELAVMRRSSRECTSRRVSAMMKMRSQYVPEEVRSTVMNFFRIPLNLFVCVILYNVAMFPLSAMFAMCTLFLLGAAFLQKKLEQLSNERPHGKYVQMTDRA